MSDQRPDENELAHRLVQQATDGPVAEPDLIEKHERSITRWAYGFLGLGFVVINAVIAVYGGFDQWLVLWWAFVGVLVVGASLLLWYRTR